MEPIDFSTLTPEQREQLYKLFEEWFPQYFSESNFPSEIITNRLIKSITWDKAQGGSLSLGGADDVNGVFYLYDADDNIIVQIDKDGIHVNDTSANEIVLIDDTGIRINDSGETQKVKLDTNGVTIAATGDITVGGDSINTNAEVFSHLSIEHFWTDSSTYEDRTGCRFALDGDNFSNQNVYYECVMANEQSSRTAYTQIYNITDTAALSGSEITSTANPLTSLERVRSSALTFPSGLKEYKVQIKMNQAGGAGDNAHYYAARLVITQT